MVAFYQYEEDANRDKFSAYKGPLKHGTIKSLQNELLLKKIRRNQIDVDEVKNFLFFFKV